MMNRRSFVKTVTTTTLVGIGVGNIPILSAVSPMKRGGVSTCKEAVAIAMWDFSWLLRHEPGHVVGSEFADWDKVLDELVDRGYNAIRLDVFPNLVATEPDGKLVETFYYSQNKKRPVMWGNQHPTTINPRQALKEFIPRCLDRGFLLGLSTWFFGPGAEKIAGVDEFVRVWDETLSFLKDNDLLHNIYYVDLLNEYPLFSGFKWLRAQMDSKIQGNKEMTLGEGVYEWKEKAGNYTGEESQKFYTSFANDAISRLLKKWPELDFIFSLTLNKSADWRVMAPTKIAALDVHLWFVMNPLLGDPDTGYWENIHKQAGIEERFPQVQRALLANWKKYKPELIEWMDKSMAEAAALGMKYGKPVGNTEGWGIINWLDHPSLSWDIIKETGVICARLGKKHGYRFNCSSNFTHPQFPRLWADIEWHQRVTGIIRGGN